MFSLFRLPLLAAAALLLPAQSPAVAESPLGDPFAPAVAGRPLDQLGPVRPQRAQVAPPKASKPAAARTAAPKRVAAKPPAAPRPAARAAVATAVGSINAATATAVGSTSAVRAASLPAQPQAPAQQRAAKQAVDDRATDPGAPLPEVGKGRQFSRKPLAEGAYIGERHRTAVRKYYEQHPVLRPAVKWKIGEPVPPGAVAALVPRGVLAVLPRLPPGHQYVELGGEVVLVASESKMVVDGVSRVGTETAQLARQR